MPAETGIAGAGGVGSAEASAAASLDALDDAVAADGTATPGQPALVTTPAQPPPTFAASPDAGTELEAVYVAGNGPPVLDRNNVERQGVLILDASEVTAIQGQGGDPEFPWVVNITDGDSAARITGYGELRTAHRDPIVSFRAGYVENTDLFGFTGTGTHGIDATTRSQEIAIDGTDGATQTWQSHTHYQLPPSAAYLVVGAVAFSDAGQANQTRRIQIGDDTDYLGFEMRGTDVLVVGRSGITGATFEVPRSAWLDPLDGTGTSQAVIDWTKFNTFEAVGGVPGASRGRAWINGRAILDLPAHLNVGATLKHSEHPLRASITNTGPSAPGHVRIRGFAIAALGNYEQQVLPTTVPLITVTRQVSANGNPNGLPVLSIRPKTTLGGQPWRGYLLPRLLDISISGGTIRWELVENPDALTGASWVSGGDAFGVEFDVSATAYTLGAGRVIDAGSLEAGTAGRIDLTPIFEEHDAHPIRNRIDGSRDLLVLVVRASLGSVNVTSRMVVDVVG